MTTRKKRIVHPKRESEQEIKQKASYGEISFPKKDSNENFFYCLENLNEIQHQHTVL